MIDMYPNVDFGARLTIDYLPHASHVLKEPSTQHQVISSILNWLRAEEQWRQSLGQIYNRRLVNIEFMQRPIKIYQDKGHLQIKAINHYRITYSWIFKCGAPFLFQNSLTHTEFFS